MQDPLSSMQEVLRENICLVICFCLGGGWYLRISVRMWPEMWRFCRESVRFLGFKSGSFSGYF